MTGTLITVAPTGAETAKADCPQLPTTMAELVETAVACESAGASLIHLHIRDADHRPSLDAVLLRETVQALLAEGWKKIVLNLSEVTTLDSAGLGELVAGLRLCKASGAGLKLLNASERVHSTIYIARLLPIFETYQSEKDALAAF